MGKIAKLSALAAIILSLVTGTVFSAESITDEPRLL